MKQIKQNYLACMVIAIALLTSCKKNDAIEEIPEIPTAERKGLYVLNEGLFNANNSSLTYYDFDTKQLIDNQFLTVNKRGLGDTGNDMKIYGSKMYIVVNVSSTLEIVNANTGVSIKKIDMKDNQVGRQPRYVVFNKNKAFVSSFDGTVAVLDTASLAVEKYIKVGRNPEQMAISNGKLYVANSGGLDYPNYDNTVSVIDLNSLAVVKTITVVENPRGVVADKYGDVYVMSTGNYGDVKSSLATIDSKTDVVKTQVNFSGGSMVIHDDFAYITASGGKLKVFNVKTEKMEKENFITDDTKIMLMYGVTVDELTGEVFIMDAKDYFSSGEVFCFDKDGKKKYSIKTGLLPNNVAFINK